MVSREPQQNTQRATFRDQTEVSQPTTGISYHADKAAIHLWGFLVTVPSQNSYLSKSHSNRCIN